MQHLLCFHPFCSFNVQSSWGKTSCQSRLQRRFSSVRKCYCFPTCCSQPSQGEVSKPRQRRWLRKKKPVPGERTELILTTYIESLPTLLINNVLQVLFIKLLYILGNNISISDCQRPCHYFDLNL